MSLYSSAREITFTFKNIKVNFAASKLILFNLNRVLRIISKFFAELIISKVNKVVVKFYT